MAGLDFGKAKQQGRAPGAEDGATFSTVPRTIAPGAMTACPFAITGAMTTASTGSPGLELRVETPMERRIEISLPAGASRAILSRSL